MKELVKKINAVMLELGAVEKKGFNSAQKYKYMAHADLMRELHPLLVKNGLVIYPETAKIQACTSETWEGEAYGGGKKTVHQNRITVETKYVITDGEHSIMFCGIGEGVDSQDKSAYKAQTGAHKYALKGLLCIPDELDAEDEKFEALANDPKENGQKAESVSMQKAGVERANSIKEYLDSNLLKEQEIKNALVKHKASSVGNLPKNIADDLINLARDRELALNDAKGR